MKKISLKQGGKCFRRVLVLSNKCYLKKLAKIKKYFLSLAKECKREMESLRKNPKKIFSLKFARRILITVLLVFSFEMVLFVSPTLANDAVKAMNETAEIISESVFPEAKPVFDNHLPELLDRQYEVISVSYHSMTAYNSEVAQCDASPCITANGFNVCEHGIEDTVAANFLRFGTKVRIPELFGDRVFVVRDRMNQRYTSRVDVWMKNRSDAIQFGIRNAKIEVVK